jgi:hypothetical protein
VDTCAYETITLTLRLLDGLPTEGWLTNRAEISLLPGRTYHYWLEDVDVDGLAVWHGPLVVTVPAVVHRIFLPMLGK